MGEGPVTPSKVTATYVLPDVRQTQAWVIQEDGTTWIAIDTHAGGNARLDAEDIFVQNGDKKNGTAEQLQNWNRLIAPWQDPNQYCAIKLERGRCASGQPKPVMNDPGGIRQPSLTPFNPPLSPEPQKIIENKEGVDPVTCHSINGEIYEQGRILFVTKGHSKIHVMGDLATIATFAEVSVESIEQSIQVYVNEGGVRRTFYYPVPQ